uniref:EF-hand domain-containing protein n=1 Tax=Ciona savignyi TaxID=51511 RepID=H2ZFS5_CIOSA
SFSLCITIFCKSLTNCFIDAEKQNENGVVIDQIDEDIGNLELSDLGIAPPKHLDAVKFGRDGNINSKYHKEVFLGEEVKKFENGDYELKEQKSQLIKIFKMIDENGDGELDENELSKWVLHKTKEHFEEAKLASEHKFNELDNDKDGSVSWNEYLVEFLGRRNFNRRWLKNYTTKLKLRSTKSSVKK